MKTKKEFTTTELTNTFNVLGFCAGFCAVEHKESKEKGSFDFYQSDKGRLYYNYKKA
jgi:hypothetical protein